MTKKLTPYEQHAQKIRRLEEAKKFKPMEKYELMLQSAAKDSNFMASLSPSTRLALAHYEKHKKLAEEVEREQEGR